MTKAEYLQYLQSYQWQATAKAVKHQARFRPGQCIPGDVYRNIQLKHAQSMADAHQACLARIRANLDRLKPDLIDMPGN